MRPASRRGTADARDSRHDPNLDTVEIYCRTGLGADELVIRDLPLECTTSHLPGGDDLGAGLVGNLHSLAMGVN